MTKQTIKITVAKDGSYTMTALEGFAGQSCMEKTKDIELILGGNEVDGGKTDDFFKPDDAPVTMDIFNGGM